MFHLVNYSSFWWNSQGKANVSSSNFKTSDTGGWCQAAFEKMHLHDGTLVKSLSTLFVNKDVASFGDGPGIYREILTSFKLVKSYTSFDGSPFIVNGTKGKVQFLDLTLPQYGLRAFDWVLSLGISKTFHLHIFIFHFSSFSLMLRYDVKGKFWWQVYN